MKSSPKLHPANSRDLAPWNLTELDAEFVPAPKAEQQVQARDLFRSAAEGPAASTSLRPAETARHFAAWLPDEMSDQESHVRLPEWIFLDVAGEVEPFSPPRIEAQSVSEAQPRKEQINAEAEAAKILEQARLQAEEMLLAAQVEADTLVSQAEDEIEAQKKDGYRLGWEAATSEVQETLKATSAIVEEVRAWKNELQTQGEKILVSMLKEIAQKMFGDGVELETHALQINLNRIMENAQGLGDLNIFINPRDAKVLDHSWSEYQRLISGKDVKIIPSGKIARGGCFVKGEMGIIDGRVETQLAAILKMLDESSSAVE